MANRSQSPPQCSAVIPDHSACWATIPINRLKWLPFVAFIVAAMISPLLYSRSFPGPYVFDDLPAFGGDLDKVAFPALGDWLHPERRPLVQACFSVIRRVSPVPSVGYRIAGTLIHAGNATMLFVLVMLVHSRIRSREEPVVVLRDDLWLASVVAGIWLIHPVCAAAVCSIVQQAELLMTIFFAGYLLVVATIPRRSIWFSASLVYLCLFCGLSSKVVMVAAIPAGILLDAAVSRASIGAVLKTRWQVHLVPSMAGLFVAMMLLPVLLRAEGGIGFGGDAPPAIVYLASSIKALSTYVAISIFPWELSIDRGPSFTHRLRDVWLQMAVVLLYVASAVVLWRRQQLTAGFSRYLAWLMLMPLIILAPTTSFVPTADPVFEHRIYLPLAFLLWLVVILMQTLIHRYVAPHPYGKAPLRFSLGIVAILLAIRTIARANEYASAERLWRTALMVDPDNARAAQNFVATLQHTGRDAAIRPELTELIFEADSRGRKIDILAHQLAKDHMRRGEFPKAYQMLTALVDRSPPIHELLTDRQRREMGERWFDLALVQSQLGRSREALQSVERVLQCSPKDPFAFAIAGDLSLKLGNTDQTIEYWGKAIEYGEDLLPELKEKLSTLRQQTAATTTTPPS